MAPDPKLYTREEFDAAPAVECKDCGGLFDRERDEGMTWAPEPEDSRVLYQCAECLGDHILGYIRCVPWKRGRSVPVTGEPGKDRCARSHACVNTAMVSIAADGFVTGWNLCEECAEDFGLSYCPECGGYAPDGSMKRRDGWMCGACAERFDADMAPEPEDPYDPMRQWDAVDRAWDAWREEGVV